MNETNDVAPPAPQPEGAGSPANGEPAGRQAPSLIRNGVSVAGGILVAIALAYILFALLTTLLGVQANPYVGLLVYVLFPGIGLVGLILVPVGVLMERRRRRLAGGKAPTYPRIDLNVSSTRRNFLIVLSVAGIFLVLTVVATYQAYDFTDSVVFCGQLCHTPMRPEFVAYNDSPHARVTCVSCHVGAGPTWYARSKFSGLRQLYGVTTNDYPRPIPTPLQVLRPVREACERCHWPEKFYGAQFKAFMHYASDEKNTPTQIQMMIDTGGGSAENGRATGIHWHMAISNRVWFVATDKQEQNIPWVKVETEDGRVREYFAKGSDPKQIAAMPKLIVECVTCHSRPSHTFKPPDRAVDDAFAAARLDPSLPFLKQQAVKVLAGSYPSTQAAAEAIATGLDAYYHNNYLRVYNEKGPQIRQAIATVQSLYQTNVFPAMKADWRTHPDNIGHLYYPGCFRCHDGQHVSPDGRVLPNDCDTCHTFLSGKSAPLGAVTKTAEPFKHPIDFSALAGAQCSDCHSGGGG